MLEVFFGALTLIRTDSRPHVTSMSDVSDEEIHFEYSYEEPWVLYRDREEWSDVVPLSQDDGPHPIVAIAYSDKFRDMYDYFRAILKSGEKSERALALTEDCIRLNSANYTVWHYRREILKDLGKDLQDELKYVESMIKHNSKKLSSLASQKSHCGMAAGCL